MKVTNLLLMPLVCVLICAPCVSALDRTDEGGIVTASSRIHEDESYEMVFDNDINTKWLTGHTPDGWIQFQFLDGHTYAIGEYTITSANDSPERSPKDWTLQGSNDDENWDILDTQEGIIWTTTFTLKRFKFGNLTPYEYYKLDVTANGSGDLMGFCEMELFDATPFVGEYSPEHETINIPLDEPLSWEPKNISGPVFEVYFSTSPSFSDVTEPHTTTETTYNPPKEIYTKYYWKVDMLDGETVYEGDVLSFTTDGKADTPDPADGAVQVGQNASLNWRAVNIEDATYNVYFQDANDVPEFVGNVSTNSFTAPAVMDPNTVYYWKVDTVCDVSTTIAGDLYSFTSGGIAINPNPPVPDSNSIFTGTDITLSWTGDREGDMYVEGYDLYFGDTFPPPFIQTVTGTNWQIPYELQDDTHYYWQVDAKHDGAVIVPGKLWFFRTGKLLGYWSLDSLACIDDVAGNNGVIVTDSGGGDPQPGPGVDGQAMWFNDKNLFKIPGQGYWDPTHSNSSVACWVKWNWEESTNYYNEWRTFVSRSGNANGWSFGTYSYYGICNWVFRNTPAADDTYWYPYIDDGFWHFVVATYDGMNKKGYVDGVLRAVAADSGMIPLSTASLAIGGRLNENDAFESSFEGWIDDVRVYSRPLSDQQVEDMYSTMGDIPKLPNPADGEIDLPWDTVLQWECSDSALSQTIAISKNWDMTDAEVFVLDLTARSFDYKAQTGKNFDVYEVYYWQVTAEYTDRTLEGAVWQFAIRDLKSDMDEDDDVDTTDLSVFAGQWLENTMSTQPEYFAYCDQEVWATTGDPNVLDYWFPWEEDDRYWGWGMVELGLDPPPPGDEGHDAGDQTVIWSYQGGKEVGITINLPEENSHVDFSNWDRMGFWVYQRYCDSTADIRILDQGGVIGGSLTQPIYRDWYDNVNYNDQWHKYIFNISGNNATDVVQIRFYRNAGGNPSTTYEEISDFFLEKDDTTMLICWEYEPEDVNKDCDVNMHDFVIVAEDWLTDAKNY